MSRAKRRLIPAVMACALGIGAGGDYAADTTATDQLQQKIAELEAKVDTLEAKQAANQADTAKAIQQVLADADKHSQLMGSVGMGSSGYDDATGFHLGSDDGSFLLHPWALFQFRGVANYRESTPTGGTGEVAEAGDSTQTGFDIRRLEIGVDGKIFSTVGYYFQLEVPHGAGGVVLDDAYIDYRLGDTSPFTVRAGQFIDPVWHDALVNDGSLQGDRPIADALIGTTLASLGNGQARTQGVALMWDSSMIHATGAIHNGFASGNGKFIHSTPALTPAENFGITGRVEAKLMGDDAAWDEYNNFSALGDKSDLLVVGAGADWTQAADNDAIFYTLDAQYDGTSGLSAYLAGLGQYTRVHAASFGIPVGDYNNYGVVAQAGYLLGTSNFEPFVRYDFTHLDGAMPTALGLTEHNVHEATIGVNYYVHGERAKITLDGSWLPNGSPADFDALGILKDSGKNEFLACLQFQLEI